MSLSMFEASVPVFITMMNGVSHCLKKAESFAKERNIDELVLTGARLAPDMFPLSRQVMIVTDQSKGCVSRLTGRDIPKYEDTEKTFAELQARLTKCMAYVAGFKESDFAGSADKEIHLDLGGLKMDFTGRQYLLGFVQPNLYFHCTTAYNILRHNGVPLGKADFFGR